MRKPTFRCALALMMLLVGTRAEAQTYRIGGTDYSPAFPPTQETVDVTFAQPDGGVTATSYSGYVRLVVSGSGLSCTPATNDAFYIFEWLPGCGNQPNVPQHDPNWYQLTFDTQPLLPLASSRIAARFIYYDIDVHLEVLARPYVPAYRTDHTYRFVIYVGPAAARLHFGVSDGGFGDNSGAFQVQVTQLVEVPSFPDLVPSRPLGLARVAGGPADSPIYAGDHVYADGGAKNTGAAAPASEITWYVDGVPAATRTVPALDTGIWFNADDVPLGTLARGQHTVRMVVDSSGTIVEMDETNNEITRTIWVDNPPAKPGDFDGNRRADISVFRPSDGTWYLRHSQTKVTVTQWGNGLDMVVPADYDGHGMIDVAVFRPSDGVWHIKSSETGAVTSYEWGEALDIPIPGDYDGDTVTDLAVFRPSNGVWYIYFTGSGTVEQHQWGNSLDRPVPGDYDGDGRTDLAVFRPSNGTWYVRFLASGTTAGYQWGHSADVAVPGDYNGDGKTDLGVYRPSTGVWYVYFVGVGSATEVQWGTGLDIPVPLDYDGDGKTDVAVFRPSDGVWYILHSSGGFYGVQWGNSDDVPIRR